MMVAKLLAAILATPCLHCSLEQLQEGLQIILRPQLGEGDMGEASGHHKNCCWGNL